MGQEKRGSARKFSGPTETGLATTRTVSTSKGFKPTTTTQGSFQHPLAHCLEFKFAYSVWTEFGVNSDASPGAHWDPFWFSLKSAKSGHERPAVGKHCSLESNFGRSGQKQPGNAQDWARAVRERPMSGQERPKSGPGMDFDSRLFRTLFRARLRRRVASN